MRDLRGWIVFSFIILLSTSLTGCVSYRRLAGSAVGFNLAVEKAQNEVLLLNAIRASKRRPMYLTGISKVTGNLRTEYSAGLDFPFGKKSESNKAQPKATYIVSPTFEVPVFDTQEFMQGFLSPVTIKTLNYYWDQGWPQSFLLHLFVHRIRIREESEVPPNRQIRVRDYYFDNYPDATDSTLCELEKFSALVDLYLDPQTSDPNFEARASSKEIGPLLARNQIGKIEDIIAATKESFDVIQVGDQFRLRRNSSDLVLTVKSFDPILDYSAKNKEPQMLCANGSRRETEAVEYYKDMPAPGITDEEEGEIEDEDEENAQLKSYQREPSTSTASKGTITVDFFLRSPEAILYYLGQLVRVEDDLGVIPEICIQGKFQPVFVARRSSFACSELVAIEYEGLRYIIPREPQREDRVADKKREDADTCVPTSEHLHISPIDCIGGRSMQSLSILSQLIALQKSAKDLPGTSLVRTIGQ